MKKIICDGNEACARASYLFSETLGIYPITPSSPMPELIDRWSNKGYKNLLGYVPKVVEMQSEAGAIGLVHGALQAGVLASTYTASQGLLLMIPNMYKIAGEMLPCVIHVAARSLATHALSIFGDHQDIYAVSKTGFCMLASSSVQDAYYLSLISHLASIDSSLPFLHFFDGFRTSHEINKIDILNEDDIRNLVPFSKLQAFRERALNNERPVTRGTNQNGDIYFQQMESRNIFYEKVPDIVSFYMNKINELGGTDYKPFNYYGSPSADRVIIAMGSICETIKEYIDYSDENLGLIEVHLYRPFCMEYLLKVLPSSVKKVAVLDRTKEAGSIGEPLYLDVLAALEGKHIEVCHGRYGLSSKDTTPGMIKAVYDMLLSPKYEFTIGINDDVTNLSLDYENIDTSDSAEILVYGYGSDGMVSSSKSLLSILGKDRYVQGYFEYDSKKSGGVTCSHLRFSNKKIRSTYFVHNPSLVVISKDTYLEEFDAISCLQKGGSLLINTSMSDEALLDVLNPYKRFLRDNEISLYVIDAYFIADAHNLGRKISMIMEKAMFKLIDFIDEDKATLELHDYIKRKFGVKSEDVALNNINALSDVSLRKVELDDIEEDYSLEFDNLYDALSHRLGSKLKVSDFKGHEDGSFSPKKPEMQNIAEFVPEWDKDRCIACSMCSIVCPHGVIRPFLLNEEEYEKAPSYIKERCKVDALSKGYYIIGISAKNCTGCGVCINTCPGLKGNKALAFGKLLDSKNDMIFDYLVSNVSPKDNFKRDTIKGSQLREPKFAFHGACAGCGETAYIKLLTQLSDDNLIIANATGCSSIYGGELPNAPYTLPWANSLFEDNAEFGYGILTGFSYAREMVLDYMRSFDDKLFEKLLKNPNDYETALDVYLNINYDKHPYLKDLKNYIIPKNVWAIGGDGWAYDIGFGGIDHVLSSSDNINILVLDTEVYSNTGGQASKATPEGMVAEFAFSGKKNYKKDLARIAMAYPNVYVAQISLGANMMQAIKAISEAMRHDGPSIIIAYCPCISHGIKAGMGCSVEEEALATKCGYFPIFRYDGSKDEFILDSPNPNFDLYEEFLDGQTRYSMLKNVNPKMANEMLRLNKEAAIKRFNFYKSLVK